MAKLVIVSTPKDAHAQSIAWAVRQFDIDVHILSVSDLPDYAQFQWQLDEIAWQDQNSCFDIRKDDLIFLRRKWVLSAPDTCHPEDIGFVNAQCQKALDWFLDYLSSEHPRWVQTPGSIRRANNKLLQIKWADKCGLRVPKSLVSNDFAAVKRFVSKNEPCIAKTIVPKNWHEGGENYFTFTSSISSKDLEREAVELCPMIYQEQITKAFEWRVVIFGDTVSALRQNPNLLDETSVDTRRAIGVALQPEICRLPNEIESKIKQFCKDLDLQIGAFDLVETPEGEFVFLEINESGQYLWLEEFAPEIRLLAKKTQFLLSRLGKKVLEDDDRWENIRFSNFMSDHPAENFQFGGTGVGHHKLSTYADV